MRDYADLIKRLKTCAELHGECALCIYQGNQCDCMPETPLEDAADAVEELAAYEKIATDEHNRAAKMAWEHRWIPVTERLPEAKIGYYVLVYEDGDIMMASYSGGEWYLRDMYEIIELKPTHWMPLPEPPKEE